MHRFTRIAKLFTTALAVCALPATSSQAEVFVLTSGARIEGQLLNPNQEPREQYQVGLASGAKLALAKSQVSRVIAKNDAEAQYELYLTKMPDSVEGHWKLAEWCLNKGLAPQREFHLQTILEREPQHKEARRALGFTEIDGRWVLPEEHNRAQGYVKHQGAWRTPQEVAIFTAKTRAQEVDRKWRNDIKMWRGWLDRPSKAEEGIAALRAIRDPLAAPALVEALEDDKTAPRMKTELIEILGPMAPQINFVRGTMANHALYNNSPEIREKCLDYLDKCDHLAVSKMFVAALKDKNNKVVNRAAVGIARMQDTSAIGPLIEHLTTKHKFLVTTGSGNPGGIGAGFGGGGGAGGGGLSAGGSGPKLIEQPLQNEGVLNALVALSGGQNFGFNKERWIAWHSESQVPADFDLRRRP